MSHSKIRALQQWCKAIVDGYKDVNITNMSSSWKDGLAFCALIHRFRPDLINFDALSKNNVYDNNQLAFSVAESLGIAALLEAKDMFDLPVPDKLSVITYVASIHNYFKDKEKLGGPGVSCYKGGNIQIGTKRHQDDDSLVTTEPKRSTPDQSEEKTKKIRSSPARQRSPANDLCILCNERVYLIEKQIDNGKLYHRSCFRGSHLSPTGKILSKNHLNGVSGVTAASNDIPSANQRPMMNETPNSTKVRLYEKRKEQIQKAEEQATAEKQREKELYEKRQHTPSALRNHLKNIENQSRENSSDSPVSKSPQTFSKQPPLENTTEQPSWAQTKLRKVFNNFSTNSSAGFGKEVSVQGGCSTEGKRSRESSPGSPVLMEQVTSRTMEAKQYHASKTVTKSSTSLEAESGKQQLVSGLLKSLATVRQRQTSAGSPSSSPPPPRSPSGPPPPRSPSGFLPFSKSSATNSFPFNQPLNSLTPAAGQPISTSTPLQAKSMGVKFEKQTKNETPRTVARIKTVITSTPKNPVMQEKTQISESKSKFVDENLPSSSTSLNKSSASKIAAENSPSHSDLSAKSNVSKIASESSPSRSASPAKSNTSKIASESSPSRSASPAKSNTSKISSENSLSRSASPAKSNTSKISSENSLSRSASPAKSNTSKISSENSLSRSASPAKSNTSKISSENSLSRSASPAKSNISKITTDMSSPSVMSSVKSKTNITLKNDLPSSSSKTTAIRTTAKDERNQSILERIEQYSKVAAGVEKPPSESSPKREIIHHKDKHEQRESPLKKNAFTTSTAITTIAVKKPLASESTKERNMVSRFIASSATPKQKDDKLDSVCIPAPVVKTYPDKNGHTPAKTGITKDLQQPSSELTPTGKMLNTASDQKRLPAVKQDKTSSSSDTGVNVLSVGLTKLHPAHYTPKVSDPSPSTSASSNTYVGQSIETRVNPIPKPRRQKPGLTVNPTKENKENPVESKPSPSNGVTSQKTTVALSERQDTSDAAKTEWQLKAERLIAARKGKYVDPETNITRFILPNSSKEEINGETQKDLKKISPASNWTLCDDDSLSLDFPYRKQIVPNQDLDSLEWSNPKKRLSTDEIQKELMDIDSKLTGLELRGRQLEDTIRAAPKSDARERSHWSECSSCWHFTVGQKRKATEDEEAYMVEWFHIINKKNELVRRENDLIYQSQEQALEEQQLQIDKELQILMQKPDEKKTKAEKKKEAALIQQKLDIVNQRDLIVDSIDKDRLRYQEEDKVIKEVLQTKGYLQTQTQTEVLY